MPQQPGLSPRSMQGKSPSPAASSDDGQKRHCWECLRRRLVCDGTRPVCKKCQVGGIVCPGYGDNKPLKWLAPGRVTSFNRTKKPKNAQNSDAAKTTRGAGRGRTGTGRAAGRLGSRVSSSGTESTSSMSCSTVKTEPLDEDDPGVQRAALAATIAKVLGTTLKRVDDPDGPTMPGLPPLTPQLRNETVLVVEAAYYYNEVIRPYLFAMPQAGANPYLMMFPLNAIPYLPPSVHHTLISSALGHRLQKLGFNRMSSGNAEIYSQLYQHRGLAIRSLCEDVTRPDNKSRALALFSNILFLATELQLSWTCNWRAHYDAAVQLLNLLGGLRHIVDKAPILRLLLSYWTMGGVFANTTSPASDLITNLFTPDVEDLLVDLYGDAVHPWHPCPVALFREIVRIQRLRIDAAAGVDDLELEEEAQDILVQLGRFSAEEWADLNAAGNPADWTHSARVYQSATTLYCIMALDSVGVLPTTPELAVLKQTHTEQLEAMLIEACDSPRMKNTVLWPLIILGANADAATDEMQAFVGGQLENMGTELGSIVPLRAKMVLQRFWLSAGTTWDECFNEPHMFSW